MRKCCGAGLADRRPALAIMLKIPRPGRVKTRLARDIGTVPAAWWMRHQTARVIRRLARDPRWRLVLAVTPDAEGMASRALPPLPRLPQDGGDLGQRMAQVLRALGPGRAALIGADIPGLRPHHIVAAFHALGDCDAVLGPAADGGFWLVGLKHPDRQPTGLFAGTRWSTAHALADTRPTLPGRVAVLDDVLADVDGLADLGQARP
jgi:rSAM/selenodomain-associated transferase 1